MAGLIAQRAGGRFGQRKGVTDSLDNGRGTAWIPGRHTDRTTRGESDWTTGGELSGQSYGGTD